MNRLPDDQLDEIFRDVREVEADQKKRSGLLPTGVRAALEAAKDSAGALGMDDVIDNYEDLIPKYLAGELSEAQVLLFEEEVRRSAALRVALDDARRPVVDEPAAPQASRNVRLWSMAAGFAVLALVSLAVVAPKLPSS